MLEDEYFEKKRSNTHCVSHKTNRAPLGTQWVLPSGYLTKAAA